MDTSLVSERLAQLRELLDEMIEAGRMRSDFALRHFVVGAHDTPGRQRAQALAELQSLYFALADVWDDLKLAQIELDELVDPANGTLSGEKLIIMREKLGRKILGYQMHLHQRVKEIDCLLGILKGMKKYTAEELEAEEPQYWAQRLTRQAYLMARDPGGNLDAMLQMATIVGTRKPTAPLGPHDFLIGNGFNVGEIADGLLNAGLITDKGVDELKKLGDGKKKRKR